jgi:hypothetical protein
MTRFFTVGLACCLLATGSLARSAETPAAPEKGAAYLGILFEPVAEALYDQLPQLHRDQGVLVTQVLADSPADKAGLRRNDILLQYDDTKLHDCDDLVRLLQGDKAKRTVKLTLLRGGKETTVEAVLALGPAIRTAEEVKNGAASGDVSPGVAKPGGPAAVSVAATPLERGRLKITIEFYPEGESRLRSVTCEGEPDEIASAISVSKQLPERERGMAQVALKRIRMLNPPKDADKPPASAP